MLMVKLLCFRSLICKDDVYRLFAEILDAETTAFLTYCILTYYELQKGDTLRYPETRSIFKF